MWLNKCQNGSVHNHNFLSAVYKTKPFRQHDFPQNFKRDCDLIFSAVSYFIQTNYVLDFVEAEKDNNLNAPKSSEDESLKEKDEVELSEKAEVKLSYQRCHSGNFNEPNIKPDLQKSLADIQTSMAGLTSEMKMKLFKNNSLQVFTSLLIKTTLIFYATTFIKQ